MKTILYTSLLTLLFAVVAMPAFAQVLALTGAGSNAYTTVTCSIDYDPGANVVGSQSICAADFVGTYTNEGNTLTASNGKLVGSLESTTVYPGATNSLVFEDVDLDFQTGISGQITNDVFGDLTLTAVGATGTFAAMKGDVDGNGEIDILDLVAMNGMGRAIVSLTVEATSVSTLQLYRADLVGPNSTDTVFEYDGTTSDIDGDDLTALGEMLLNIYF